MSRLTGITMFVLDPATQTIRRYPAVQAQGIARVNNPYPTLPGFGLRVANARRALRRLGADCLANIFTRGFDTCFEMGDGEAVVFALMQMVADGDDLLDRGIRNAGGSMHEDWLRVWQAAGSRVDEPRLL